MAKISKVFYLVLVLTVLLLGACKKSSKGRSINVDDPDQPYPNGANYSFEVLADDDRESLDSRVKELPKSNAFPEFKGPKRVEFVGLTEAYIYFDAVSLSDFPEELRKYRPNYMALARNAEGVYIIRSMQDVVNIEETDPREDRIFVPNLNLGEENSVRLMLVTYEEPLQLDFNRHVINFHLSSPTLKAPQKIVVSCGTGTSQRSSCTSTNSIPDIKVPTEYFITAGNYKFFSDSACTQEVQTPLTLGEHHFYATFNNDQLDLHSPCSTSYASYTVVKCPEDYLVVQPDQELGTPAFCIMRTEARRGANDVAVPGYEEYPWETTPQEAKDACRRVGPNCDLITNLEWMAAAREIEWHYRNWAPIFHSLWVGMPSATVVANIEDPSYYPGSPSIDRRSFYLNSGILWDFAGNLAEWADNAVVGGEVFQPITNTCPQGPFELMDPSFSCPELDPRYYTPINRKGINLTHTANGVGKIVGPAPSDRNSATPIAAARGGQVANRDNSGIYSLFMFNHLTDTNGFRCVCHIGGT